MGKIGLGLCLGRWILGEMRSFRGGNEGCLAIAKYFDDFFVPCTVTPLCLLFCSTMVCPVLRFTFDKDLSRAGYS